MKKVYKSTGGMKKAEGGSTIHSSATRNTGHQMMLEE